MGLERVGEVAPSEVSEAELQERELREEAKRLEADGPGGAVAGTLVKKYAAIFCIGCLRE